MVTAAERLARVREIQAERPGEKLTFIEPGKKPKVEGVQRINPETGELGGSFFTADKPGETFVVIEDPQIKASRKRIESKTEREFAAKQRRVTREEGIKLRAEELERKAKFLPPGEAVILKERAVSLRSQLEREPVELREKEFLVREIDPVTREPLEKFRPRKQLRGKVEITEPETLEGQMFDTERAKREQLTFKKLDLAREEIEAEEEIRPKNPLELFSTAAQQGLE